MMNKEIQQQLLDINHRFYDQFAASFSSTRGQVQPGVRQLLEYIDQQTAVLDVGCGNGTLARALAANGFRGRYLGMDMSEGLLFNARTLTGTPSTGTFDFRQVDLAVPGWQTDIPESPYDWLTSFAVLHHLPGEGFRHQTASAFADLVAPESLVAVSAWQWQNSARLKNRVLPWSTVGLNPEDLDKGDVLLDWRAGNTPGLRYVYTFTQESLTALAESAGFRVIKSFYSDGKTGDLALYQIWQLLEISKSR